MIGICRLIISNIGQGSFRGCIFPKSMVARADVRFPETLSAIPWCLQALVMMQLTSKASGQAGPGSSLSALSYVAAVGSTPNPPGYYKSKDVCESCHEGDSPARRSLPKKPRDRCTILYTSPSLQASDWMQFGQSLAAKTSLSILHLLHSKVE